MDVAIYEFDEIIEEVLTDAKRRKNDCRSNYLWKRLSDSLFRLQVLHFEAVTFG